MRQLKVASLDSFSRETSVPVDDFSRSRDEFLEAGQTGLKRRSEDSKVNALGRELKRTYAKLGELMMDK